MDDENQVIVSLIKILLSHHGRWEPSHCFTDEDSTFQRGYLENRSQISPQSHHLLKNVLFLPTLDLTPIYNFYGCLQNRTWGRDLGTCGIWRLALGRKGVWKMWARGGSVEPGCGLSWNLASAWPHRELGGVSCSRGTATSGKAVWALLPPCRVLALGHPTLGWLRW